MGVDRLAEDDRPYGTPDAQESHGVDVPARPDGQSSAADRAAFYAEYKDTVDATYRADAIEKGCERVREIEDTIVTPAMHRIEAEDPDRHLVGLEFRLKSEDRLTEKVAFDMQKKGSNATEAFANIKDAIRYTFQYPEATYARGVHADVERLKGEGFEQVDLRNSWSNQEYKGINTRWRIPGSGQLFEVQFHTRNSFEAKQETHSAYEMLRDPATSKAEQRSLEAFQRAVSSRIPIPYGATDIPNYP